MRIGNDPAPRPCHQVGEQSQIVSPCLTNKISTRGENSIGQETEQRAHDRLQSKVDREEQSPSWTATGYTHQLRDFREVIRRNRLNSLQIPQLSVVFSKMCGQHRAENIGEQRNINRSQGVQCRIARKKSKRRSTDMRLDLCRSAIHLLGRPRRK
jgi:hypothetical protein